MRHLPSHSGIIYNPNGAVLLMTLLFLLLLTIIGTSSLYLAFSEAVLGRTLEADAKAFYTAESGVGQILYWFNNPDQFTGTPEGFFTKRRVNNTSFFSEDGMSQYSGTGQSPDLTYSMQDADLKVYGPTTRGAVCTIESSGISGRIRRTVTAELFEDAPGVKILRGSWRVD